LIANYSSGHGADSVLITADTDSDQPVQLAGEIARDKGIVVAVGAIGMNIPRRVYYEKELDLRISRSYGPGRYDREYEEKGHDYPYAYVRWTEQRNMQAFMHLLSARNIDIQSLVSHRFPIEDAARAYDLITGKAGKPFLGVLLTYPPTPDLSRKVALRSGMPSTTETVGALAPTIPLERVTVGVIGAGNFANATLLPAIKGIDMVDLIGIASTGGLSARSAADRFGFAYCTTDVSEILTDPGINTVAILTRHHLHAQQVISALEAGKHVFVEKPLCITEEQLLGIISTFESAQRTPAAPALVVGFNRRFAPFVVELRQHLDHVSEPLMLHYRVNAGYIPQDHWVHDPDRGGGRLLGEACHFIDLLIYLAGDNPRRITARALPDSNRYSQDNLLITLEFENGSLGTVTYAANGDRGLGKELLEVFGGGLSARLEDFRSMRIRHGSTRVSKTARLRQDKGHRAEWRAFASYLTGGGPPPMSLADLVCSTSATLAAQTSVQTGESVKLGGLYEPC
jgi:predicted dehydrogenase